MWSTLASEYGTNDVFFVQKHVNQWRGLTSAKYGDPHELLNMHKKCIEEVSYIKTKSGLSSERADEVFNCMQLISSLDTPEWIPWKENWEATVRKSPNPLDFHRLTHLSGELDRAAATFKYNKKHNSFSTGVKLLARSLSKAKRPAQKTHRIGQLVGTATGLGMLPTNATRSIPRKLQRSRLSAVGEQKLAKTSICSVVSVLRACFFGAFSGCFL
ncbi:hypothetical protein N7461_007187 [Penicillium sp. DV-2018c]|nr:hypothetical protein N7461_007187 [Penicillium sp. DV-2018c]